MVLQHNDCAREGGGWALPKFNLLDRTWAAHLGDTEADCLAKFGLMTLRAVELDQAESPFNVCAISQLLRIKMQQFGWISSTTGSMRVRDAARSWSRYWKPVCRAPDFGFLHQTENISECYFRDVVAYPARQCSHPLQLLMAIDWLVGDLDVLVRACTSQDVRDLKALSTRSRWGAPVARAAVWRRVGIPLPRLYRERPAIPSPGGAKDA